MKHTSLPLFRERLRLVISKDKKIRQINAKLKDVFMLCAEEKPGFYVSK